MSTRKIAVPVENGMLAQNFNDADKFYIYDIENNEVSKEQMELVDKNTPDKVLELLKNLQVTEVLGAQMEKTETDNLLKNNVGVILSAPIMHPKDLVIDFMKQPVHNHGESCCGGEKGSCDTGGGSCGCDH